MQSKQFKNRTGGGSESEPVEQFKNRTNRKTELKHINKQQQKPPAVAVDFAEAFYILRDIGFDEDAAITLSRCRTTDEIKQQIDWLPRRNVQRNQLGFLRRAIEEDWAKPSTNGLTKPVQRTDAGKQREDIDEEHKKAQRLEQREARLAKWRALDEREQDRLYAEAIDAATSEFIRTRLQKHRRGGERPSAEVLEFLSPHVKA